MNFKDTRSRMLIYGMFLTSTIYLIWRVFYTLPIEYGLASMIPAVILLIVEIFGFMESAIHFKNMYNIEYPEAPEIDYELYPEVDVFIATYNEPVDLLYKTVNGCVGMDYPDKKKVHVYLCDDSNRDEVKKLAERFNIGYITREEHKHAKAGNLNNALLHTKSPLIVTFDADMIPMHDFLMATVPYFLANEQEDKNEVDRRLKEFIDSNNGKHIAKLDIEKKKIEIIKEINEENKERKREKIGFIQTPQSFYNPDLFQYNLFSENRVPNEQDYFYKDIQVAKNKSNSVIYGGSNTVISREALEEVGGFYTKTITEDFATGMLIQSKGYRCYALNEVHASGLSPSDLKSLIKQRERWARGCIQTGRKLNILFRRGLSFTQKVSYISAITYWYSPIKRLVYMVSPILFSVFGLIVVKCSLLEVLIFWLPMHLFMNASLKLLSNNIRNLKLSNLYETILFPSLFTSVILETLGISKRKFSVTNKEKVDDDKKYKIKKAIPHVILAFLSVIALAKSIALIFTTNNPAYFVVLFWLIINVYSIVMSIFFISGRKLYRADERFVDSIPCTIKFNNSIITCTTIDISEGGLSIGLKNPEYIPYEKELDITVNTDRYLSRFKGEIVQVVQGDHQWKYAIKISNIDENNYKELLNLIYDREPSLTKTIEDNNSIFDDIKINIQKRYIRVRLLNRKLPRINLRKDVTTDSGEEITILNFNYEYMLISSKHVLEVIDIALDDSIKISASLVERVNYEGEKLLYKIVNRDELTESHKFKEALYSWADVYRKETELLNKNANKNKKEFDELAYL